ncbi:MAG: HD domain-containing protein [Betaproteobacteria bacterium]
MTPEIETSKANSKTPLAWLGEENQSHLDGMLAILQALSIDEATQLAISHLVSSKSLELLAKEIGEESTLMIKGYRALVETRDKVSQGQSEILRKMLLAFSQDLRVVIIYLASRLQTLRWITAQQLILDQEIFQEILDIDASLANRLGVWQIKWEMEDLAFRNLEPTAYRQIARLLDSKRQARQKFVENIIEKLQLELSSSVSGTAIEADIQGRPKHIYSIWKKMQGKALDFADLYDVRAFRIIVKDIKACYTVLGLVHHIWRPIPKEFDDYIARPKPNGYQSLHTVVMDELDVPFEIQIRTQEMHHQSEYGVAAHWRYKEGAFANTISANAQYEQKIAWARQLIAWKNDTWDQLKGQTIDDNIYVMTPLGRLISLEPGATPLDFAYSVHTNLGHRCRGARVDSVMVPLDTVLKNGQTVEIITVKEGGPSRDWLMPSRHYLATHRAKSKVRAWFNALDGESESTKESTKELLKEKAEIVEEIPVHEMILKPSQRQSHKGDILVVGVDSLMTQLSKCCRPIPPDEIRGFITKGRGVSIHRKDCQTLKQLIVRAPERVILTSWDDGLSAGQLSPNKSVFPAEVYVEAIDRQGLLRDISEVFSKIKINVTGVNTISKRGIAKMQFTVEVPQLNALQIAQKSLEEVKGVTLVYRK